MTKSISRTWRSHLGFAATSTFRVVCLASAMTMGAANADIAPTDRDALQAQANAANSAIARAISETSLHRQVEARKSSFLALKKKPGPQLDQNIDFSEALAGQQMPTSSDPKAVFDLTAAGVEAYCANAVMAQQKSIKEEKAKAARINASGLAVAALGGVTVNPPYKAFLMAIGISGGGESKSVFGVLFGSQSDEASVSQSELDTMRTNYQSAMKDYRAVDPKNDQEGTGRGNLLVSAKSACDQMYKADPAKATETPKTGDAAKAGADAAANPPADAASKPKK